MCRIASVFLLLSLSLFSCKNDPASKAASAGGGRAAAANKVAADTVSLEPKLEPVETVHVFEGSENSAILEADKFEEYLKASPNVPLIDLRSKKEYDIAHLHRAVNMPFQSGDFEKKIKSLQGSQTIAVYCRDGATSAMASDYMEKHGTSKIIILKQGVFGWTNAHKVMTR